MFEESVLCIIKCANKHVTNKRQNSSSSLSLYVRERCSMKQGEPPLATRSTEMLCNSTGGMVHQSSKGYCVFWRFMRLVERAIQNNRLKSPIAVQLRWDLVSLKAITNDSHHFQNHQPFSDSLCPKDRGAVIRKRPFASKCRCFTLE